ncbi:hypothetical protein [Lentzea sp. NBRC 102530]|uniref:Rv1733c family protein n=1 Tax=Lentzea sp. NBRC 102530 TaxID=3032201 RepID=UPI0025550657|nr:hypothetical protein [Lentzea sp. NBRC 102530]
MNQKPIARALRQAFPGRNELATAGDRLEGALLALVVAVAVLAVPVAAAAGSEFHARQRDRVVSEQDTRWPAEAVLLENAAAPQRVDDRGTVLETTPVPAEWRAPDGETRQGEVQAHHGAPAGSTVPIWVDHDGVVTPPPLSRWGALLNAIGLALAVWGGATAVTAVLYALTRFAHTRSRRRRWEREWRQVSRDGTVR